MLSSTHENYSQLNDNFHFLNITNNSAHVQCPLECKQVHWLTSMPNSSQLLIELDQLWISLSNSSFGRKLHFISVYERTCDAGQHQREGIYFFYFTLSILMILFNDCNTVDHLGKRIIQLIPENLIDINWRICLIIITMISNNNVYGFWIMQSPTVRHLNFEEQLTKLLLYDININISYGISIGKQLFLLVTRIMDHGLPHHVRINIYQNHSS